MTKGLGPADAAAGVAPGITAITTRPASERSQTQDIPGEKLDAAAAALQGVVSRTQDYQERMFAARPSDQERVVEEAKNALVDCA
jgi:hypothetical protein